MTNRAKGICCILTSAFGFAVMALFVRMCDDYGRPVSCFQKSFFRNLIAFAIALPVFFVSRSGPDTSPLSGNRRKGWFALAMRCVFGTIGIVANFHALSHIPIGEGMALNKTAPLFTVMFSWLFLGERMTYRQFVWLLSAFAGMMLVMKPGFGGGETGAMICALAGGLFAGAAYSCLRRLGRLGIQGSYIVLVFSAFSCLAMIPFVVFAYTPMTGAQLLILLGSGFGAALGQFGITRAYRYAQPRSIAVYDYMNVVFTAALGLVFFGQIPDAVSAAGFAVIIIAALKINHPQRNRAE